MRYVTPKKNPFPSWNHMEKSLRFAKVHRRNEIEFWKRIIWIDESVFNEGGSTRKAWVEKDEPVPKKYIKKFPITTFVWGAIGWYGESQLYFITPGKWLTASKYKKNTTRFTSFKT